MHTNTCMYQHMKKVLRKIGSCISFIHLFIHSTGYKALYLPTFPYYILSQPKKIFFNKVKKVSLFQTYKQLYQ